MKKGKKIWNRLLSLVLCLVMILGSFVGMGMEVKAAEYTGERVTKSIKVVNYAGEYINGGTMYFEGYFYLNGEKATINGNTILNAQYRNPQATTLDGKEYKHNTWLGYLISASNRYVYPSYSYWFGEDFNDEYETPPGGTFTALGDLTIQALRKNVSLFVELKDSKNRPVTSGVTVNMNGQSDDTSPYYFSELKEGNSYNISVTGNGYNANSTYTVEKNGQKSRIETINIGAREFTVKADVTLEGDKLYDFYDGEVYADGEKLDKDRIDGVGNGYNFHKKLPAGAYRLTASGVKGVTVKSELANILDNDTYVELKATLNTPVITGAAPVKCGNTLDLNVQETVEAWDVNYTWSSSDKSVATIDANGVVTPLKVGTTDITVTCSYGNQSQTSSPVTITVGKGEATHPTGTTFVGDDVINETVVTIKVPENSALNPGDKATVKVEGACIKNGSYTTATPLVIAEDKTVVLDLSEQLTGAYLQGNVTFDLTYRSDNYNYNPPTGVDSVSRAYYITKPLEIGLFEGAAENPELSYGDGPLTIKAKAGFDSATSRFTYSVSGAADVLGNIPTGSTGVASSTDSTIASGIEIINASPVDGTKTTIKVTREKDDTNFWAAAEDTIEVTVGKREINPLTTVTYANEALDREYNGSNEIAAAGTISVADEGKVKENDAVSVAATLILPSKDADTYTSVKDSITIKSYSLTGADAERNYKLPETIPTGVITSSGTALTINPKKLTLTVSNGAEFALNYQDLDGVSYETVTALNEKSDSEDLIITVNGLVGSDTINLINGIVPLTERLDVGTHKDKICVTKETANAAVPSNTRGTDKKNYIFEEDSYADLVIKEETITGLPDENLIYDGENIWVDVKENENDVLWIQSQHGLLKINHTEKYNNRYDSVIKASEPTVNLNEKGIESTALQNETSLDVQFAVKTGENEYKNNSNPYTVPYNLDGTAPVVSSYKFVENQTIFSRSAFGFDKFTKSVYTAEFTVTDEGSGFTHDDVEVYVYKLSDTDLTNGVADLDTVREKVAALTDNDWTKAAHVADNKYSVKVTEAASGQTDIIEGSYLVFARVTDNVNNRAVYSSNGIVVEGTTPQIEVTFKPAKDYYNSSVNYVIDVTDLGYEELKASGLKEVSWTVFVDGQEITELAGKTATDSFESADAGGEYALEELKKTFTSDEFTIPLEKYNSNDVVLRVTAVDKAGNIAIEEYLLANDTTDPVINVKYDNNSALNTCYFRESRTAEITYTERNFDKALATFDLTVGEESYEGVTLEYINENVPGVTAYWGEDSQADREVTDYTDARTVKAYIVFGGDNAYSNFVPYCKDLAGNANEGLSCAEDTAKGTETAFVIDTVDPSIKISNVKLNESNSGSVAPVIEIYDENLEVENISVRIIGSKSGDVTEECLESRDGGIFKFKNVGSDTNETFTIMIRVIDQAGNETVYTNYFSVRNYKADNTAATSTANQNGGAATGGAATGGAATGDNANLLLWGVILIVGAAGTVAVAKKRRKNEES